MIPHPAWQAEALLAKESIRHLVVTYSIWQPVNKLLVALRGRLPSLRSVVYRSPQVPLKQVLGLVEWSRALETVVFYVPNDPISAGWTDSNFLRCPDLSLTRLELRRRTAFKHTIVTGVSLDWLIKSIPRLQVLIINHPMYTIVPTEAGRTLTHLSLHTLELRGCVVKYPVPPQTSFVFPNLRILNLSDSPVESYIPYLFPPSQPANTEHLTHLLLRGSEVDEPTLIGHLPHLVALTHLDVRGTNAGVDLFGALSHPASADEESRLCPRLERVDFECSSAEVKRNCHSLVRQLCQSRFETGITVALWLGPVALHTCIRYRREESAPARS